MKIRKIISQSRRDFRAIYECESCTDTSEGPGYDDSHFHNNVVPAMVCKKCGEAGSKDYRPLATKHQAHQQV